MRTIPMNLAALLMLGGTRSRWRANTDGTFTLLEPTTDENDLVGLPFDTRAVHAPSLEKDLGLRVGPHRGERVVGKRAEGSKWYEGRWYSPLHMRTSKRGTPAWLAQSHGLDHDPTEVAASPTQADLDRLVRELMESISEANLLRRELHAVREQVTEMYTRNEALAGENHNLRLKLKHCEQVNLKLQQLVQQYRDEALIHPRTAATINQAIAQLQRALRGE